ncbi:major facilitator superfamily domain-containing protein [Halenospora varia]|nr:major facilitator superfamily domain-containing protein [Halenospora varia]
MSPLGLIQHLDLRSSNSEIKDLSKKEVALEPATLPSTTTNPIEATATTHSPPSTETPQDTVSQPDDASQDVTRPKFQVAIIMSSLCACVFVAAIDITIISTALPSITSTFHSSSGYSWIASSYVLGNCASTPSWGKISDIWGRKLIMLLAILIFFVGSLICALGETMGVFLAGRAVQGVGAAGLLTLVNIAISDLFSMRDRSLYYGLTSLVWALASGVGPVLGGVFAQRLSWRWCFWVNLPISALVFIFLLFSMPQNPSATPIWTGLKAIDWTGSFLITGSTLMLLLALNFGGVTFAWKSATIICLLIFSTFTFLLFSLNEWKLVKYPVIPLRLFRTRSSAASFAVCFCHGFVMMGVAYYLPLYFQAVLGAGPLLSGVYLLPFIITDTAVAALTGVYIQQTGRYIPAVYLGLVLMTLGTGLLIDLPLFASWPKIIIYQMLVASGIGMNFEGPLLAVQACVGNEDVAVATATMGFVRVLSTAVSAVIGGVVFQNQMAKEKHGLVESLGDELAGLLGGKEAVANVEMIKTLTKGQQVIVKAAFGGALKNMWIMYLTFAVAALLAGCFIGVHVLSKEVCAPRIGVLDDTTITNQQTDQIQAPIELHVTQENNTEGESRNQ